MRKMKINAKQLPVKAHYFFFMAAMGPILPFITVYGKQLGVSPMIMGTVTAVLPLLFIIAKPCFGFVVDYFRNWRKFIFVGLILSSSLAFVMMYFIPGLPGSTVASTKIANITIGCDKLATCSSKNISESEECDGERSLANCNWYCEGENNISATVIFDNRRKDDFTMDTLCLVDSADKFLFCDENNEKRTCSLLCEPSNKDRCLYGSLTFWGFVILVSLGCIGFNVSNSISDAICFDMLGPGGVMSFGRQRVWGTIGFGVTAFLAGYTIDVWSQGQSVKSYTPAFILVFAFTCFDVICCTKLELPTMSGSKTIAKDIFGLLRMKPIVIFLTFATIAGILDSFLIFFLFWYLEDLAVVTGHMGQIKLIEGLIVAAETLGGEVIFFLLSGKILKKFGYGYSFVFCFACYALRLCLISLAPNPWWVIPIEFVMQGPTYALCYTTIVAFASVIAPPGTSATVQGIVAGMDDGFGYAVGSLVGGILFKKLGGATSLRIFATLAAISSILYLALHVMYLKHVMPDTKSTSNGTKLSDVKWKSPKEALKECENNVNGT